MCVVCATCLGWVAGRRGNCSCVCTFARISGGGGVKSLNRALLLGLAALVAVVIALDLAQSVQAQSEEQTGRIVARRLDDGRTEFGWQPSGGERVLPAGRYFPANIEHTRWLRSTPVEIEGREIGRINARLRSDGRIEFGFTPTDGERILPPSRNFPTTARVGRWLRSTEIAIPAAPRDEQHYGQIIAHRIAPDDRFEFGWQPTDASGEAIGPRVFPSDRYLSQGHARWWSSSPIVVDGKAIGWITARMVSMARVEFGFTRTDGERILPPSRHWASNAPIGHLQSSTTITLGGAPPPPPVAEQQPGRFSAVSAGGSHTCAIRAGSGEIACWGSNRNGRSDAPAGRFSAIDGNCAIRADTRAIECWGENPQTPLAGRFSAIDGNCAIRADTRAIECWGWTYVGPDGRFSAVSAGVRHACAIRESSRELTCWGSNGQGQLDDIPAGRFNAVSAGVYHTCALRPTGEIACWGASKQPRTWDRINHGQTKAPAGSFRAVSAGGSHTCGLRTTGGIRCWGENDYAQASAPAGSFAAVSAGFRHACALRPTGEIACWGSNYTGQSIPPAGRYTDVSASGRSASGRYACALREDGAITCWGEENDVRRTIDGDHTTPPGRFQAVINTGCGLREAGWIECWGSGEKYQEGQTYAPRGQTSYAAVASDWGDWHTYGLRSDGAIEYWIPSGTGAKLKDAPAGRFSAIGDGNCAIRESGEIACWGRDGSERFEWPDKIPAGRFSAVSGTIDRGCAIRETGELACWGRRFLKAEVTYDEWRELNIPAPPPAGRFRAVIVADESACAIRESGEIECWGHFLDGSRVELPPTPAGRFSAITAGNNHTCAIREDGAIVCWGERNTITLAR